MERLIKLAEMDPDGQIGFLMLKEIVNPSCNPSPKQLVWVSKMIGDIQGLPLAEKTVAIVNIATYINSCK